MALARISLLKSDLLLNEGATTFDAAFEAMLTAVSKFVDEYTGRTLIETAHVDERHTGDLTKIVYADQYPITTFTAAKIWDTGTETFVAETTSYFEILHERQIYYPILGQESNATYSNWPATPNGIKLSYTAGYDDDGWDDQIIKIDVASFTTAPAVGDVLTQANSGGTITVTSASTATNTATGTPGGTGQINLSDAITSNNVGATMAPASVVPTKTYSELTAAIGVPADLEYAVAYMTAMWWMEGKQSEARLGITGLNVGAQSLVIERYEKGVPPVVENTLRNYKRPNF